MGPWLVAAAANGLMRLPWAHLPPTASDRFSMQTRSIGSDTAAATRCGMRWCCSAWPCCSVRIQPGRHRRILQAVAWAFLIGIVLFAGSLYLLALTHIRAFAWITPFGGVTLMAGWFGLILLGIFALARNGRPLVV